MKPMLAVNIEVDAIRFPVYASPKLDGVRGLVIDGQLRSRSLKRIPNKHVDALFSRPEFNGLDGELIVGSPTAKDVYRVTQSALAREEGEPAVTFYVFDDFSAVGTFGQRLAAICARYEQTEHPKEFGQRVVVLEQRLVRSAEELLAYEQEKLAEGYEGLILRAPAGAYKHGRSTANEQGMLKLKRFADSEAVIIGMEEEMFNGNAAQTNALGRTERSTSKAGLTGKGRMGALVVRDLNSNIVFNIGTGFTAADRELFWKHREQVMGMVVKYKSFLIGVKEAPRFPVYLGMRNMWDMSK